MKLTKDTIKKLNKENIKIHINVIEEIDLNELVGQEINELSGKDFENAIKNKQKNYFYTINDEEYYTTSAFKSLLNAAQSKTAQDTKQDEYGMNQEFDGYGEYDENNNVKECHCEHCTCKKELHLNNEFNMDGFVEFLKDPPVDDIPCVTIENKSTDDIPYIAIENTGEPSFYQETNFVKIHDSIINLRKILGWEENKNYYLDEECKFYKIKNNSLYERNELEDDDSFKLISEKYSEDLFNRLKNAVRKDYYSYFEEMEECLKNVKTPLPKLTIEEFWNKLIELDKNDNNLKIKRRDRIKNLLNHSFSFYYLMYSTILYTNNKPVKIETEFKNTKEIIRYPIPYNNSMIFNIVVDYDITSLKRFIKERNLTNELAKLSDELVNLINERKYCELEELIDNSNFEKTQIMQEIADYYYTNYEKTLEHLLLERELAKNEEFEQDLIAKYILNHKTDVSKEIFEDVELYEKDYCEWLDKHQIQTI